MSGAMASSGARDPALCAKPRNRSLFWPNGPITARHTKNREWLVVGETPSVWSKSGPPIREERVHKGQVVAPLLDPKHPARLAGRSIVELRRDLRNDLGGKSTAVVTLLEPNLEHQRARKVKERSAEYDDLSDDELWESVGLSSRSVQSSLQRDLRQKAISGLVAKRCLDGASPRPSG
mmetsp:Transcript_124783/g.349547  ORF Transcript_124783/g.349547 Transcript_124783/m.349547 type:complete len:178 (+) Transcript_124783:87-620(+)